MASEEFHRFMKSLAAGQPALSADLSIDEQRKLMADMVARMHPAPSFARYEAVTIEGVDAEVVSTASTRPHRVLLYVHGGAFKLGSPAQDRHLTAELARSTTSTVVAVDYALAPEHKFPVALEQCVAVYQGLLSEHQPSDIVLMGVSAGGTLVLALILTLKDRGLPLPAAVVAVSPATYLDSDEGSHTSKREADVILGQGDLCSEVLAYYAPDADPRNPYVSPLYGDYNGFPPLLLVVGTDEILLDDSIRLADKAGEAGVQVELVVGEEMPHAYPVFVGSFPEADTALSQICDYIDSHFVRAERRP